MFLKYQKKLNIFYSKLMYKSEIENEKKNFLNKEKKNFFNKTYIFYIRNIINYCKSNNNYKITYYYKYILFILLMVNITIVFITEDLINENVNNEDEVLKKGNRKYLKMEMINKFNFYINFCDNSKLIKNKKYKLNDKPKISVIMPIYNGAKYLKHSLSSIQNQNMKDIEIILIDDFSLDNTIIILEEYMKNDQRIRLIKNNKNKKIL